ncbi:MAG: TatD family hydrolase [Candidatus Aenigmatarchaeota archaeon]
MIDVHCHLEQSDYDKDRDQVVEDCKKDLKAIITSCAHPMDFDLTMQMSEKYKNFVFASCGIHPEYIKEISEKKIENIIENIKQNKDRIVAIGEVGLDFYWVKEPEWQQKQRELFIQMINLAKEMKKPLVIHSRNCHEETIRILEQEDAREVDMHMFGDHHLIERITNNGWSISMNTIILRSKSHKKIARDCPLENLMLETDAPWLAPKRLLDGIEERNSPLSIRIVAEKIAEIKKVDFDTVWKSCGQNAVKFFRLPLEA